MRTRMWKRLGFPLKCQLLMVFYLVTYVIIVNCDPGPGTIYYRKPTKLVFYKKYPPVLIYPKNEDIDSIHSSESADTADIRSLHSYSLDGDTVGHAYSASTNGIPVNHHVKYGDYGKHGKYFLLNPHFLNHLIQYEDEKKYYLKKVEKKPVYDNWLAWLLDIKSKKPSNSFSGLAPTSYAQFDSKFMEPVYTYHAYPRRPLSIVPQHQHIQHAKDDVKPVVEHIEDDIKYDFRTKTHSYD